MAGRPYKDQEFTQERSRHFFERLVSYIEENEDVYFLQGAYIHLSKVDKRRYHKNTAYNIINKFKNRDNKEDKAFGNEMEQLYLYAKDIVEYRIASQALLVNSNVYAGQAQFTLVNNHGWSTGKERNTNINMQGTGKVVIKSEGEDPEVS